MVFDADSTVAIVGASLAGIRAAEALRAESYRGRIVVVGAEPHLPYDRPPLSKQLLAGTWDVDRLRLRRPEVVDALGLEFRLGRRATALDVDGHALILDDDERLSFDGAVVATGAHPRTLAGTDHPGGVFTLRTVEDCLALRDAVAGGGTRLVVVGAGFIGSEVAATCHGLGARVTVVEALPTPLERVLGEQMGAVCAALHTDNGVEVRTGVGVAGLVSDRPEEGEHGGAGNGAVSAVALLDGSVIPADVVVVGIGVVPTTGWLADSGLDIADGVGADPTLHAADDVVVAGDVARWFDESRGSEIRVEHWTNAADQGVAAARSLLAGRRHAPAYASVPYFWSDQYDAKIQVIGLPRPDDDVVVVDGSLEERRFVALYSRRGTLSAVLGFSRPRQLMGFRPLLEAGASLDDALARGVG